MTQSYEDKPFSGLKWPTCSEQIFLGYKPLLLLSSTYWSFLLCKILKSPDSGSRVMTMHHFCVPNWPFAPKNIFQFHSDVSIIPIHCAKLKKILQADPELWGSAIFGPKMSHFLKWEFFFRKPVNESFFFHSSLSACLMIKEYWILIDWEPFLSIT